MASANGVHLTLVVNCVFNAFFCLTTIVLNIITIQALRKTSSLPKTLITLLLNLAVSDLGVGLLVQPLYVVILVMNIEENSNITAYYSVYKAYLIQKKVLVLASHLGVFALTFEFNCVFTIHFKPAAVSIENNTWSRGDIEFIFECSHAFAGTVGVAPFRSPKIFVNDCVSGMVYLTIKRTKNIVVNLFCVF